MLYWHYMKKKSTKLWIVLLSAPIMLLFAIIILNILIRMTAIGPTEMTVNLLNLGSFLIATLALLGLLGSPLWIALLIRAITYNNKINAQQGERPAYRPPVVSPAQSTSNLQKEEPKIVTVHQAPKQ